MSVSWKENLKGPLDLVAAYSDSQKFVLNEVALLGSRQRRPNSIHDYLGELLNLNSYTGS
jgi:hypothetical protein